tara:strand:- start:70 stop:267 length:198 start_codon:yes stop_codon:yes gene_type:complete
MRKYANKIAADLIVVRRIVECEVFMEKEEEKGSEGGDNIDFHDCVKVSERSRAERTSGIKLNIQN